MQDKLIKKLLEETSGECRISPEEQEEYSFMCELFEELKPVYLNGSDYTIFELNSLIGTELKAYNKKMEIKKARKKFIEEIASILKMPYVVVERSLGNHDLFK